MLTIACFWLLLLLFKLMFSGFPRAEVFGSNNNAGDGWRGKKIVGDDLKIDVIAMNIPKPHLDGTRVPRFLESGNKRLARDQQIIRMYIIKDVPSNHIARHIP